MGAEAAAAKGSDVPTSIFEGLSQIAELHPQDVAVSFPRTSGGDKRHDYFFIGDTLFFPYFIEYHRGRRSETFADFIEHHSGFHKIGLDG